MQVHPNPIEGNFNLEIWHPEVNDITINIYNDIAQLIFSNIYSVDEYRLIPFYSKDLNLAKGVYTIQGLAESKSTWLKIVNL